MVLPLHVHSAVVLINYKRTNTTSPVNERTRRISGPSVSSVTSTSRCTRVNRTTSTGKKAVGGVTAGPMPPIPVAESGSKEIGSSYDCSRVST
jgi:hypothetical protein